MALFLGWLVDVLDDEDVKTLHVLDDSRKLTHQQARGMSEYARTLNPVFTTLLRWGVRHLQRRDTTNGTRVASPD
jgi:hypothetical protein